MRRDLDLQSHMAQTLDSPGLLQRELSAKFHVHTSIVLDGDISESDIFEFRKYFLAEHSI